MLLGKNSPIPRTYSWIRPQMTQLGFFFMRNFSYQSMPRSDQREKDDKSLSWFEPTVELHQTRTFEGRSTDWATAPRPTANQTLVRGAGPVQLVTSSWPDEGADMWTRRTKSWTGFSWMLLTTLSTWFTISQVTWEGFVWDFLVRFRPNDKVKCSEKNEPDIVGLKKL